MYRLTSLVAAILLFCGTAKAQTDADSTPPIAFDSDSTDCRISPLRLTQYEAEADSALLRSTALFPTHGIFAPAAFPHYIPWTLHEGLNAQFAFSISAAFGRRAPRGAGFGEQASLAYALPVGKHGLLAAGIYAANLDWGGRRQTDVGLSALYAHEVNERLTLYAHLSKRLAGKDDFLPAYPLLLRTPDFSAGAGFDYKLSERFGVGFSVSVEQYKNLRLPVFPHGAGLKEYGSPLW